MKRSCTIGKFVLLVLALLSANILFAQKQITGTVFDEEGELVIGATVKIKANPTIGTITNLDGKFTIQAKEGDVLVVSAVGCLPKEVTVDSRTVYTIILEFNDEELEEAVVYAYSMSSVVSQKISGIVSGIQVYNPADYSNTEEYANFSENPFKRVEFDPVSTFSADVDGASYSNVRRFVNQGFIPPRDAIRTEELVNYFSYKYNKPLGSEPVAVTTELGVCPWNSHRKLFRVGIKAKEILTDNLPASNFVFLIDVSGSMEGPTRLELVKSSLRLLINNLRDNDRVAIVVYAGSAGEVLPSTLGSNKQAIKEALDKLQAGGSTAGGEGIQLAYKIARQNFIQGGNNRIILCTDGDFNVGVSSDEGLEKLIEKERNGGVFLTVLGYGMGNYKDSKMQVLAQKGNGNHAYIDDIGEANRVLVGEAGATLYAVAKDVKLQVEFNPNKVYAYRLIGYETRLLNKEDFDDDTKDAGEMGAGSTVTAFYELIIVGEETITIPADATVGEQKTSSLVNNFDDLLTVKVRYKEPDGDISKLIEVPFADMAVKKTSEDFKFASAVAMFGQLLRNSEYKGNATYQDVIKLANSGLGSDKGGYRKEFVKLVRSVDDMVTQSIKSGKPLNYGYVDTGEENYDDDFNINYEETEANDLYGLNDKNGQVIFPPKFNFIYRLIYGYLSVELNDKYGLANYLDGKELTPIKYDDIEYLAYGLFLVEINGKYGLINKNGYEIVPVKYDDIDEMDYGNKGLFLVGLGDKTGIFDYNGKEVVPAKYDDIEDDFCDVFFLVEKNDKYGVIDYAGKLIIPVEYDDIDCDDNYNSLFIVEKNDKYGVFSHEGKKLIPPVYDDIDDVFNGVVIVEKGDFYGAYNSKGKNIIPVKYEDIEELDNNLFLVEKKDRYGVFNAEGKTIIPVKYEDVDELTNDLFTVEKKERYGVFNTKGKKIVPAIYDDIEEMDNGMLLVERNDFYGVYSTTGKKIISVLYDDIDTDHMDGFFLLNVGEKYGLADKSGKIIVPVKYDDVDDEFENGWLNVTINDKEYYYNRKGKRISESKHERMLN